MLIRLTTTTCKVIKTCGCRNELKSGRDTLKQTLGGENTDISKCLEVVMVTMPGKTGKTTLESTNTIKQ